MAGAYGYASVTMGDANPANVDYEVDFDFSATPPGLEEDQIPTAGDRQADGRRRANVPGPSRRSRSLGKRKQIEETVEQAQSMIQEVRQFFRGRSQTGSGSQPSVKHDVLLSCINIMKGMGYSAHHQMMMWHYFEAHPGTMSTFCQIDDDLRREIIGSVINSQPPAS